MADFSEFPKRFLLIRTDRIGDTVLTLPAVTAIRTKFPDAFIAFLGQPYTAPLIEQYEGIDVVLSYEPQDKHKGILGHLKLSKELKKYQFDVAFLFYPRPELAFIIAQSNISVRVGTGFRWYSFLLNRRIYEHRKECLKHEAEYNLALLSEWMEIDDLKPQFSFKKWIPEIWWDSLLLEIGNADFVIIHPGSGASAPNLNVKQYRLLIEIILKTSHFTVILTGSPNEQSLVEQLSGDFPEARVKKMAGKFALDEFMTVIRNAKLLITSSTGPLHIANALGTPLLGFFCPAKPHTALRWGPYNQQDWVLTPNFGNQNDESEPTRCKLKKCKYSDGQLGSGCLQKLSDTEVEEALLKRL